MYIYQWILRDNQEMSFQRFILTKKFYADFRSVEKDLCSKGPEFSVVEPYLDSRVGGYTAELILRSQNEQLLR